jgi:hypothetical protein
MQQLCRIFETTIEETIRNLKKAQSEIFNQRKALTQIWISDSSFEELYMEWDQKTTYQVAQLKALVDRVRKKGEEVVSLRDGVSLFEHGMRLQSNTIPSSSTLHPSEKPLKALKRPWLVRKWLGSAFGKTNTSSFSR